VNFDFFIASTLKLAFLSTFKCYDLKGSLHKTTVGNILALKAKAQNLLLVTDNEAMADEVYDTAWAMDISAVTQLLVD